MDRITYQTEDGQIYRSKGEALATGQRVIMIVRSGDYIGRTPIGADGYATGDTWSL